MLPLVVCSFATLHQLPLVQRWTSCSCKYAVYMLACSYNPENSLELPIWMRPTWKSVHFYPNANINLPRFFTKTHYIHHLKTKTHKKNHKNITSSSLENSETKTKIQRNCQLSGHLHHPIPSSLRPPGFPNDQRTSPLQCWPPSRPRSLHHDQLQCQGDVGALGATNTWPNWKLEHPAKHTMQTRSVSLRVENEKV